MSFLNWLIGKLIGKHCYTAVYCNDCKWYLCEASYKTMWFYHCGAPQNLVMRTDYGTAVDRPKKFLDGRFRCHNKNRGNNCGWYEPKQELAKGFHK